MNLSIKRKPLIKASVGILFIFILSFGYLLWTQQVIQLTVADIEILSIEVEHNPSIQQINTDTNEQITLPEDVSYTIKYKIIRPFTDEITGYYFGQDTNTLYVDIRGKNTLFPSKKEQVFQISSDAKIYGENEVIEIDENYTPSVIKDKAIKILKMKEFTGDFTHAQSTPFIDQSELPK